MDAEKKKALADACKKQNSEGGIYCIACSGNGQKWIKKTRDIAGIKHRFDFSLSIGSCPEPVMRQAWDTYGAESFSFTVLETLKMGDEQTAAEYSDDLDALLEMCVEKMNENG